jgi:hypothetical protein
MLNDSVNIEKHIKHLLKTFVITENAMLREKLRKIKHHKHLSQPTRHQLHLYTIMIKPMYTFKKIFTGNPFGYARGI